MTLTGLISSLNFKGAVVFLHKCMVFSCFSILTYAGFMSGASNFRNRLRRKEYENVVLT